ncbi:hypothetical protein V1460_08215 [Streptomyces sp. SCSIO 30461]|uniref:hypothetical protein n=1 Tax=Streptomyces sp. SCSIO 30461 TaxID=3118085 RepID=UPI0030D214B0
MAETRTAYFADGYSEDFGLTGLTEQLYSPGARPDQAKALGAAARIADESGGEYAAELGEDARRLLESSVPDETLHTVWLAAVGRCFDPVDHGMNIRAWLEELSELSTDRLRCNKRSYVPPPVRPVRDEELCRAVVAELRGLAPVLEGAGAGPELADGLEQVVTQADADLGLRLMLRALKVYGAMIEKERYDRLLGLGGRFGYPVRVVRNGLKVQWPPIDTTRRDTDWDFGLSCLTTQFVAAWHDRTARGTVQDAAARDEPTQTPGSAAAILLEDTLRLLESELSTENIATLWVAATDRGYSIDQFSIGGRDWLRQIAEVCREHLGTVAPEYIPVIAAAWTGMADRVLRELREVTPLCAGRAVSPRYLPIPAETVLNALEEVITRVDPDLGFRLFLRVLLVLSVPLTKEQYGRYETIGADFGYGEFHVYAVADLVHCG